MNKHSSQIIKRSIPGLLGMIILSVLFLQACAPKTSSQGGVLKVALQPIVQVDPAFISSDPEVLVASHIYDYLLDITPDNTIAPRLAVDWMRVMMGCCMSLHSPRELPFTTVLR
jgi:ABC-type oligopeptide transport system substrate-binding subunit